MSNPQQRPDQDGDAYSERITVLGRITPALLEPHVGKHVQALTLGSGVAGHLERIEGDNAVIINGWGTTRLPIAGRWWLLHPGLFTLGGKPVGSAAQPGPPAVAEDR